MRKTTVGSVLALLAAVLQVAAPSPAMGLTLPVGFTLVDYATGQAPYNLTNFAWLDDGGLLTSGKDGTITFVPPGGAPREIGTVPSVRAVADHGLLGFSPANDYATTGHVFVTYDKGDPAGTGFGMVEEWKALPAGDPTTFTYDRTIIDGSLMSPQLAQEGLTHAIDTVLVAPDDSLYVTIGDNARNNGDPATLRAQDVDQPYGKLLHLWPDGSGVTSNPFYSASAPKSWRSLVYAYGFRNPFRVTLDPRSGLPRLGDVGWNRTEEVDTVVPGADAGWPCYEGTERTTFSSYALCRSLYRAGSALMPIWTYGHAGTNASVVGGVHYQGTSYPDEYRDAYFFGDYTRGKIWTLATDPSGALTRAPEPDGFAVDAGGPVAFQSGPNGDITYADIVSGTVRRLVYAGGNRSPVPHIVSTTDPDTRTVQLDAGSSYDLDGDALTYHWDLGDGAEADGADVEHTYTADEPVTVTLTATDQLGATGTTSVRLDPTNHEPQLSLTAPAHRTYAVGEAVTLSATASDVEDGELTVSWDTALRHCPFAGSCHLHPDGTTTGAAYDQPFTDHGSDTTMVVTARAEDSAGAVTTAVYVAEPRLRSLVVDSPVPVAVNGELAAASEVVPGSVVQVDAVERSAYWRFRGWSDGGAAAHSFTMPDSDVVLSARYRTAIANKYAALGRAQSLLGEPTSPEYDVADGRARNYTGGRIWWSRSTGPHEVHGAVLRRYASAGYAGSCLGFPLTDVRRVPGGLLSRFVGGTITYDRSSHTTKLRC